MSTFYGANSSTGLIVYSEPTLTHTQIFSYYIHYFHFIYS